MTETDAPKTVTFKCPDCGSHRIEEIMADVTVASEITCIVEGGDLEYGEQTNDGGVIDRYQCIHCGFVIPDCTDAEELFTALDVVRQAKEARKPNPDQGDTRPWYLKCYECPSCGEKWTDEWDCLCDDKCPKCNTACSPIDHEQLNPLAE